MHLPKHQLAKCHLLSHLQITGIFPPCSQPSHCTGHTQQLWVQPPPHMPPSVLNTHSWRASYSLSCIPSASKPCFCTTFPTCWHTKTTQQYFQFSNKQDCGKLQIQPYPSKKIIDTPGKTPGDTGWLCLSILLTFYIKYYFIIMQIKSTSLYDVFCNECWRNDPFGSKSHYKFI